jgi:hypothetical protein
MSEENLSAVKPEKESKQDKEALRQRRERVEHSVWTDRMLRTLERGIEGGKWFALIDKETCEVPNIKYGATEGVPKSMAKPLLRRGRAVQPDHSSC